jgi:toxin-antitoxin system PIN domain toxin
LDSNVLIALTIREHVHHETAIHWWSAAGEPFATCPITQGALVRQIVREGRGVGVATRALGQLVAHARHVFWADSIGYGAVELDGLLGHGQVTDAYLAALARHRGGRLATLDGALAAREGDVATLLDVPSHG